MPTRCSTAACARSGKALVPFRITGNIDGRSVPEVDGVSDVTCWCWPEPVGSHQLYAHRARTRCQGRRRDRGRRQDAMGEPIPRRSPRPLPAQLARLARLVVLG
ncbi:MAG: hypothetical protein ACLRM9_07600 [Collinsella aerofaciens]